MLPPIPELFPWTIWCCGQHPFITTLPAAPNLGYKEILWGSLLFCLVLQKIVSAIATCSSLLFRKWYIDDGVLAGPKQAVAHAPSIIQELGPPLAIGLHINNAKYELYSLYDLSLFPSDMKRSKSPILKYSERQLVTLYSIASFLPKNMWRLNTILLRCPHSAEMSPFC